MRSVAPVSCVGEKRGAHLGGRARAPPRITRLLLIDQHSAALPLAHTHTPTRTHIYPHTSTIKRIIYTLYTPCRVRAVYNMYNNNIYFVVQCSRRQNIIIISNIILWRDVFYYTLRPRSLSPTWRQKNQFMTRRDFKTRTEYTTCV